MSRPTAQGISKRPVSRHPQGSRWKPNITTWHLRHPAHKSITLLRHFLFVFAATTNKAAKFAPLLHYSICKPVPPSLLEPVLIPSGLNVFVSEILSISPSLISFTHSKTRTGDRAYSSQESFPQTFRIPSTHRTRLFVRVVEGISRASFMSLVVV